MSGGMEARTRRTNLIFHHGVTDIVDQAVKLAHILCAVQEPCDLASLFQWDEVLKDIIQFPIKSHVSDRLLTLEIIESPFEGLPPYFLPDLTLGNRDTQRFCQPFNSGYQRLYPFATRYRLLGRLLASKIW